jgi:RNA polymerase sigma factor (sigma-70 family)
MSVNAQVLCHHIAQLTSSVMTDRLASIARHQTQGSQVDWQDALQSALTKLLEKLNLGKFHGDESDFIHWASIVAKRYIIDLVRVSKRHDCAQSLDQTFADTNQTLLESLPDPFCEYDALEQVDLILKSRAAIHRLDREYPQRQYLKLWQGLIQKKPQSQIARELGMKRQSDVSRRKTEIIAKLSIELDIVNRTSSVTMTVLE